MTESFRPFQPPLRLLMGPGPSDVHPRVLAALARPTVGHLDPEFGALMEEVKELLRRTFRTQNRLTFPVSGPGSAGMETCFVNLLEAGDTVIVCRNGVFGERMRENVERCGATAVTVDAEWGRPVDVDAVEDALRANPGARALAFVHAETSTGAMSDAKALCALAAKHGALSIVDTVTSLGGVPVEVDDWGADAVYSGTQKCLSCVPGIAPVTFSERAAKRIEGRNSKVQSWFLDVSLVMGYWNASGARTYHHTAPVNAMYALHEALLMLDEEGLETAWARHRRMHEALAAGLDALGLGLQVAREHRLPQLNAVKVPAGIEEAVVRRHMLTHHSVELGAGLGPLAGKIWRIGLMGQSATANHVLTCLAGLEGALVAQGEKPTRGAATAAALDALEAAA